MDKGNPHKNFPESPKEFGYAKYYWQRESAISRGSAGSEWGLQILKYADDSKLYPSSFLTWHRLLDSGKSTYLCFLLAPHQGFLLKHSHMLELRRGLEGGKHSDERAIHRKISSKGNDGEREMWGEAEEEMYAWVC